MFKGFNALLLTIIMAFIAIAVYYINHIPKMDHKITYLALGDSYTIGYKVRYADNYPNQLADLLHQKQIDIADPSIIAYPGWTIPDLEKGISSKNIHDTFSFVTILIGNNDFNRGWSVATYRSNFDRLLKQAIVFAGGHPEKVFVLSVPDVSITPYARGVDKDKIAKGIKEYNAENKEITETHKCQYIDITNALQAHATDADYYLPDWVHPTAKGYAVWASQIFPIIERALMQ